MVNRRQSRAQLDHEGLKYAKLLADPCHQDLTRPTYGVGPNGYLIRLSSHLDYANEQGGVVVFPNAPVNVPAGSGPIDYVNMPAVVNNWSTVNADITRIINKTPGGDFLSNAATYRAIAACVTLRYSGTELARSGVVSGGMVTMQRTIEASIDGTSTVDLMHTLSQPQRMPNMMEVKWLPGEDDIGWQRSPNDSTALVTNAQGHTGLMVAWDGMKTGGNMVISITVVYEWLPPLGASIPRPMSGTQSHNSMQEVRSALTIGGKWIWQYGPQVLQSFLAATTPQGAVGASYRLASTMASRQLP